MEAFIYTLIDMSLVSVYCILIVLLLRLFLRKAPKMFSYLLWAVVFLRLVLPVFPEAPVSLVPEALSVARSSQILAPASVKPAEVSIPDIAPAAENQNTTAGNPASADVGPDLNLPDTAAADVPVTFGSFPEQTVSKHTLPPVSTGSILFILWAVGLISLCVYNIVSYILLHRRIRGAAFCGEYYVSNRIRSPFVTGLFRPRIYLPMSLGGIEKEYVLMHEREHIRRFDYFLKLAAFIIASVHWFNPLAWIAFLLMTKDMEMSCDEAVIRNLGYSARKDYSTTLLSVAAGSNLFRPASLAFGAGSIKGRIRNVMNCRKPALWIVVISILLVAGFSIGLMLNPGKPTASPSSAPSAAAGESTAQAGTAPSQSEPAAAEYTNFYFDNHGEDTDAKRSAALNRWAAIHPIDVSGFMALFENYGYTVSEKPGPHSGDTVYTAEGAEAKGTVRCTQFADVKDAYAAMDSCVLDMYGNYGAAVAEKGLDSAGAAPEMTGGNNAVIVYDIANLFDDNSLHIAYLSGSAFIEAVIPVKTEQHAGILASTYFEGTFPVDTDSLIMFLKAMDDLGFGYPGRNCASLNLDLPQSLDICTQAEFEDIMTSEGFDVSDTSSSYLRYAHPDGTIAANPLNNVFFASNDDFTILATLCYADESKADIFDRVCLFELFNANLDSFDYWKTGSYRAFTADGPQSSVIWMQQGNCLLKVETNSKNEGTDETAALRSAADKLFGKLCIPE